LGADPASTRGRPAAASGGRHLRSLRGGDPGLPGGDRLSPDLSGNPLWLDVHALASVAAGLLFVAATVLLWVHRDGRGLRFGLTASVISLTVLALVAFYVNQFAAIGGVAVQAVLVVGALEHRASIGTGDGSEDAPAPSF
jgi:hypothetical protein